MFRSIITSLVASASFSTVCLSQSTVPVTSNASNVNVTAAASSTSADAPAVYEALPRNQRPKVVVQPLEFNVALTSQQMDELNSMGALLSAIRGGDAAATMQQTGVNLGRAAADLLTEQLVASGRFRVLDRRSLADVKAEQSIAASVDGQPAKDGAPSAMLIGARYVITGAITKFGQSKQSTGGVAAAAGAIIGAKTGGLFGGFKSGKTVYEIGMSIRVVDTETGEVVASMSTEGTVEGDQARTIAGGGVLGAALAGGMSKSKSGEREKRIVEALTLSAANMTVKLVQAQSRGDIEP